MADIVYRIVVGAAGLTWWPRQLMMVCSVRNTGHGPLRSRKLVRVGCTTWWHARRRSWRGIGLADWGFAFDRAKRRGGACHFVRRQITMAAGLRRHGRARPRSRTRCCTRSPTPWSGGGTITTRSGRPRRARSAARARRCHAVSFSEPALIARCVNGCFAVGRHRSRRNMRCRRCGGPVPTCAPGRLSGQALALAAARVRSSAMQPVHATAPDHLVELGAVGEDQADALGQHVDDRGLAAAGPHAPARSSAGGSLVA